MRPLPSPVADAGETAPPRDFLGHPPGLAYLFLTEMWERFSYYGMRALLVLYMVKYLFVSDHVDNVIGYGALKNALESAFGPLGPQPLASQVYGLYTGLVYFTPLLGGLLADRVLGQRRTVILGASLMALGHFMMAFEQLLFLALLVLIFGSGAFKPNTTTQVGALYPPGDPRRDRGYSIYYVGINLGAFFSPLVCGTLGERIGWHYGFAAAGVGMLIGLVVYLLATPYLPPDEIAKPGARAREPLSPQERRGIWAIVLLSIPVALFWATYEQQGNTITLWADDHSDRMVHLLGFTAEIPTTWFQAFNPFMIFAFTPLLIALWTWQGRHGHEPSTLTKMALGCFGLAAGNLILMVAAMAAGPDKASWLWLFAYFVVITIGELYLSPVSLSLVSKIAPARMASLMMAVWLATSFSGNLLAGFLGSYWSAMGKPAFFLLITVIATLAGIIIALFQWPLRGLLRN
ncbi:MAG: peptide MFS transporter [Xanthobacteraceae bacterium]